MSKKCQENRYGAVDPDVSNDATNTSKLALYTLDHWENDAFLMRGQQPEERSAKHFEMLKVLGAVPDDDVVHTNVREGYRTFLAKSP